MARQLRRSQVRRMTLVTVSQMTKILRLQNPRSTRLTRRRYQKNQIQKTVIRLRLNEFKLHNDVLHKMKERRLVK